MVAKVYYVGQEVRLKMSGALLPLEGDLEEVVDDGERREICISSRGHSNFYSVDVFEKVELIQSQGDLAIKTIKWEIPLAMLN
ncbi:MAG: hypothetical protein KJ905_00820 [Nanoarchaeota archaeon]|nr:hypothetical protein [Nanoarchaeota archaeon]MBU1501301.1 hypothetical protein [Nanoarchaeota archaeon]MBU2459177.1 hypothetical protein [Nanoarchaeota archaeon]